MSDIAIEAENLSKTFRVYPDLSRARIKQAIFPWRKYYSEKVALSDVSLKVRKGEVLGVLGPNGAGKTTLLKMIAGISQPTSGSVCVNGRVVTVLALGLGFHPRLTGSENLMLAGLMLGMKRREINNKRRWISEFSELGEYMDRPMTTYSSGMKARLSFSLAAAQTPEILIIDEALATGDIRFVQKCISRIQEIVKSGTTAMFVSHNIWSIKRLTNRSILLDRGRLLDDGETPRVADRYYEAMLNNESLDAPQSPGGLEKNYVGSGEVRLVAVSMRDSRGKSVSIVNSGERAQVVLEIISDNPRKNISLSLQCHRNDGVPAFANGSLAGGAMNERGEFVHTNLDLSTGINRIIIEYESLLLAPGDFYLDLQIFDNREFSGFTSDQQFYFKSHVFEFSVKKLRNPNRFNLYYQPARIFPDNNMRMDWDLLFELSKRKVLERHLGSALRLFWIFFAPIIPVLTNVLIFYYVAKIPDARELGVLGYSVFVLTAILPYRFFQRSIVDSSGSLLENMEHIDPCGFLCPISQFRYSECCHSNCCFNWSS